MSKLTYKQRVKAVKKAIELSHAMEIKPPVTGPFTGSPGERLERFEVVELARFLLGLEDDDVRVEMREAP